MANDTTRRGGQRTRCEAVRRGTTQQEGGADDARGIGGGGHDKRKVVEDPMQWRMMTTHSRVGGQKCELRSLRWPPIVYDRYSIINFVLTL